MTPPTGARSGPLGRVLYGMTFCAVLPLVLVWWARSISPVVNLPVFSNPWEGPAWGVVVLGVVMMLLAWHALWRWGGGLPMNAYPTTRRVTRGIYRVIDHPIYVGSGIVALGVSALAHSSGGFWVATPTLWLACLVLVWGYERSATRERLGPAVSQALLSSPPHTNERSTLIERLGVAAGVLIPWVVIYEMVGHLPVRAGISALMRWERNAPVFVLAEPVYASVYVVTPLAVFFCRTRADLHRWGMTAWAAIALGTVAYIALPVVSEPRPFEGQGILSTMLRWERIDGMAGRAAFPSFHVFWIIHSAATLARGRHALVRGATRVWAAGAVGSCWLTGMHALLDLVGGVALYALAARRDVMARVTWAAAENVANSWREWRIGSIRVINHGIYAGIAAALGVCIAGFFAGSESIVAIAMLAISTLVGAGLFGQFMVGSPNLLRPFGYFGAVVGGLVGLALCGALGLAGWELLGAMAVAAPWVQAIGRCRCLIQGCCHGHESTGRGIAYVHPRSRVVRLSKLGERNLHATPLYSIIGNVVIGAALIRMAIEGAPVAMLGGAYLVLAGLLRFVEEHYRGEPQTRVIGGLRVYQWFAVVSVLAGIVMSGVCASVGVGLSVLEIHGSIPESRIVGAAVAIGVAYFFAMGVDFPDSSRRLSRLV